MHFGFQLVLYSTYPHPPTIGSILNQLLRTYLPNFSRKFPLLQLVQTYNTFSYAESIMFFFLTGSVLFTRWNIINYMRALCHSSCVYTSSNSIWIVRAWPVPCHAPAPPTTPRFQAICHWHAFGGDLPISRWNIVTRTQSLCISKVLCTWQILKTLMCFKGNWIQKVGNLQHD